MGNFMTEADGATTRDWIKVTEGMSISSYDPPPVATSYPAPNAMASIPVEDDDPLFGTNLREAAKTVKKLIGSK